MAGFPKTRIIRIQRGKSGESIDETSPNKKEEDSKRRR
jgi:hypothetical protein